MPDLLERLKSALADRYAVESEIGRGGMATVFLAEDLRHDRRVAIKVLHPELAATLGTDRFLREIKIAAGLNHPHILPLHDSGEADGLLYFVMPYVEGESLRELLEREGQLPLDKALSIAAEVADGLDYAHQQGVVHRDIKPGNILLSTGHAQIADFGVARAVGAASEGEATLTGLAVGTPKYMSPEQASAGEVDGRSDVYALGCVLWEMVAGEPPWDAPTPHAVLARKAVEETPDLLVRRRSVPADVEAVIVCGRCRPLPARNETGHRIGAIRRLQWSDVDLEAARAHWRAEVDKIQFDHTTPLSESAVAALRLAQQHRPAIGDAWVVPSPGDDNRPCSRHVMRSWWKKAEQIAELEPLKGRGWHSLRRKFATELKGEPLKDLCQLGGWKDPQTVLKCYQTADEESMREALSRRQILKEVGEI